MRYLSQLLIIMLFSFAGELCNIYLPFPIPASVYGMVFLFLALISGVVKLSRIEDTANFLLDIMPILFVGPTVSLVRDYVLITDELLGFIILCVVSTIATLIITGHATQLIIRLRKRKGEQNE